MLWQRTSGLQQFGEGAAYVSHLPHHIASTTKFDGAVGSLVSHPCSHNARGNGAVTNNMGPFIPDWQRAALHYGPSDATIL